MVEHYMRKTRVGTLDKYCHFQGPEDYIEVTEWFNGEGVDVIISRGKGDETFKLTYGEFELLQVLMLSK